MAEPDTSTRRSGAGIREVRSNGLATATGAWVVMVVVALANAVFRELFVTPAVGTYPAHVISTVTLLLALAVVVYRYFERVGGHTRRERLVVGVLWAGLTIAFELGFGHYVAGDSWAELLGQYDVTAGRIWILVPLSLLAAPALYHLLADR